MKKVISAIAASVLAVSAFPISSASAIETAPANELSVSTEVLETSITVGDTVIPAGATAVTVSIDNNAGFNSSTTKLNIGDANVVTDSNGSPVFSSGDVLDNFSIASASKDNLIVVSSASANYTFEDGEMFTFYVSDNYSGATFVDVVDIAVPLEEIVSPLSITYSYHIGDVNDDGIIDSSDASYILQAIYTYADNFDPTHPDAPSDFDPDDPILPVSIANEDISTYFSHIHFAQVADTNKTTEIDSYDADNVLAFYSYLSVGHTWAQAYAHFRRQGNYCSELFEVTVYGQ